MMMLYWLPVVALIAILPGCNSSSNNCKCDPLPETTSGPTDLLTDRVPSADGPPVENTGAAWLRQVLQQRYSAYAQTDKRSFSTRPMSREDVLALLWAAQGVTRPDLLTGRPEIKGRRTAPSAGALYPIELYVAAHNVSDVDPGLYWYRPVEDKMELTAKMGPLAQAMADAAVKQQVIQQAAANFLITWVVERTAKKYGTRAETYIHMEAGHVAQNILLMATARGLDARPVAAIEYQKMTDALGLPADHFPGYLVSVGVKPEP